MRIVIFGVVAAAILLPPAVVARSPGQAEPQTEGLSEAEVRLYETAGGFRFANGRDARQIPFEINSDKIYLQARINGQGPFWMMLDTGSPGLVLDTATARRLGLEEGATGETTGAGESTFPLTAVEETVDVALDGLELLDQRAAIGPLDAVVGPYEGRRLEGVLGCHNLLTRFRVEIDYGARELHVRPFEEAAPAEDALVVSVNTDFGHPMTEGTLLPLAGDAVTGTFLVDTGMRGSLLLPTFFVDRNALLERSGPTVQVTSGGGIGGQVFTHLGRARRLTFGEVSIDDLPVNMSQATEGLLAEEWNGGVIGADILQRFRVVFDYANARLLLHPRSYDADDLDYDKSGLFLVSEVDDRSIVKVLDVAAGSPAAAAGVRTGDRLQQIDGRPVAELGLEEVRRRLRLPAGTELRLVLAREGQTLEARLRLRPLV